MLLAVRNATYTTTLPLYVPRVHANSRFVLKTPLQNFLQTETIAVTALSRCTCADVCKTAAVGCDVSVCRLQMA